MPTPKNRQNSGISMLEKEQAQEHLNKVYNSLLLYTASKPAQWELRTAMAILGMEVPEDVPRVKLKDNPLAHETLRRYDEMMQGQTTDMGPGGYPAGYPELGG